MILNCNFVFIFSLLHKNDLKTQECCRKITVIFRIEMSAEVYSILSQTY